ncbi:hypothetical protein TSUD_65310 [Trifolium subterraneum]|uniref:Legume lectin domain-containing protein n=1 Tax=Trifolium subterraneum TaxID=3900 RepID=A0A2Z6MFD1_TRISU|nr:hypothetical protein TSUD_65310 [Trifolium subterraneum]
MVPMFYYARGTILIFILVLVAHAHLVSFDYPMFSHNCEEPLEFDGDATIEDFDYTTQLTGYPGDPVKASDVGRVANPKLDDFTKFSNYSEIALDTTFCLAMSGFPKGNHIEDRLFILVPASEVALNSTQYSSESVDFHTLKNDNLSVSKYSSKNNNLNVSATGYRLSEGRDQQNFSHTIDLKEHLAEYVGISASTGKVDKKHMLRFWSFSTTQANYEVDHENKRNLIKIKLWEGLAVGCVCLTLGLLAMLIILLWKKNKGKEEVSATSETLSDQNMDEEFQMEYMDTGKARKESDIFSFGVVLLEIACGKKAIHYQELKGEVSLVEWVWELYRLRNIIGAADPKLYGQFDLKELECLLVVGLWCANPNNTSRPSIKKVIKVLNFEAPLPTLPQNMPFLGPLSSPIINEQFFLVPSFF